MELKGIDVSTFQNNIDYNKVKNSGINFVMIRSSYGWFNEDNGFRNHVKGCEAVGLPYGLYHYSYALNLDQAKKEAEGLINLAKSCNPTYPIVLDMEDADGYKAKYGFPSKETLVQICEYILDSLEKAGFYAMLYASKSWFDTYLNDNRLNRFDKWLAHWGIKQPSMSCGIWQYTSTGKVDGVNGNVDMNISYKDYPYIIKGSSNKPATPVQPAPQPSTLHSVGEKVRFSTCYVSSTAPNSEAIQASKMSRDTGTITKIVAGAKNPYLLDDGLCWVNDGDIREVLSGNNKKFIDEIAREVIRGDWGNGQERKDRLAAAGYDPKLVQDRVNELY